MRTLILFFLFLAVIGTTHVNAQVDADSIKKTFKNYSKINPQGSVAEINILWRNLPLQFKKDSAYVAYRDYSVGLFYYMRRNADSALYHLNKVGNNLSFKEDPFLVNEALILKAMINNIYGEKEIVQKTLDSAYANIKTIDSIPTQVQINVNRAYGAFYTTNNEQEKAIDHLLEALQVVQNGEPDPRTELSIKQNLGELFLNLQDIPKARSYFTEVQAGATKYDIPRFYNVAAIKLADLVQSEEELTEKITADLQNAMTYFIDVRDKGRIVETHNYLGKINQLKGDYSAALVHFEKGLALSEKMQFPPGIVILAKNLGLLNLSLERYQEAQQNFEKAQEFVYAHSNIESQIEVEQALAESFEKQGVYDKAYTLLQSAKKKSDSINVVAVSEKVQQLETEYQTKEKEQQIALLTTQQALTAQQQKNQRTLLIAGVILTAISAFVLFILYRNRKNTNTKLKELDKAKSTFFANISHEFRTPLTLVKGPITDQLEKKRLPPTDKKKMTIAYQNLTRVENLVAQMLALSKLESGHYKLNVKQGDINQFIKVQASAFQYAAEEKNLSWNVEFKNTTNEIWFDYDALEMITTNLFSNAIKYTPQNEQININGEIVGNDYVLNIINSGVQIAQEHRKQIFERFYQPHPDNPGTGIGLALSKELAQLHKGKLLLKDASTNTTHFELTVGVSKTLFTSEEVSNTAPQLLKTPKTVSTNTISQTFHSTKKELPKILLADDNKEVLEYLTLLFKEEYEVYTALNGMIAFEIALEILPDIIISDVMMPELDGFELTKKIKLEEISSHIPIVLVTAKTEDKDKIIGSELGADGYVTKPFNSTLLKSTVSNLLENRIRLQERYSKTIVLTPQEISITSAEEKFLLRMQAILDKNLGEPDFTSDRFSKELGVSRMQLHRKIKALTGLTTSEFLKNQRVKLASSLLEKNNTSVSEVAYMVGFNNPSYFSKCFKEFYGVTPTKFQEKA